MKKTSIFFILIVAVFLFTVPVFAWPSLLDRAPKEAEVPIIMYHLITNNTKYQGKFGVSPAEMEDDLKYLKENGYETILMSDLIDFVNRKGSLPEKPIILTFDDGCGSDYHYLFPLLKQYNMKAVLSIIGKVTDDFSNDDSAGKKPHLTWEQIQEMHQSNLVEIQNHSYDLHGSQGSGKKKGESTEAFQERLQADLSKAQEQIKDKTGNAPTTYTYPFGIVSEDSLQSLQTLGFQASLSCAEGVNIITQDKPENLFRLKRNIRSHDTPIGSILEYL